MNDLKDSEGGLIEESHARESVLSAANKSALTTVARSLGGSAALGLLAALAMPEVAVVAVAAAIGLVGGFLAKELDKQ